MAATFSQQLRYLKKHEPALYESISKVYRKCLMESDLGPAVAQPDDAAQTDDEAAETPAEKTEIKQTSTKGVDNLMDKIHDMVGVNDKKKEGEEIFDLKKDDDVETVKPDPQQQADLFGETPPEENTNTSVPAEEPLTDDLGELDMDNLFTDEGTNEPATENTETEQSSDVQLPDDLGDLDMDNLFTDDGTNETATENTETEKPAEET